MINHPYMKWPSVIFLRCIAAHRVIFSWRASKNRLIELCHRAAKCRKSRKSLIRVRHALASVKNLRTALPPQQQRQRRRRSHFFN